MDRYAVGGLVLASVLLVVYGARVLRSDRTFDLGDALRLVLSSGLIAAGVRLTDLAVTTGDSALKPFTDEDRYYIVIAALAMAVLAIQELLRVLR